jgi:undecaprenyl-diphosphatase
MLDWILELDKNIFIFLNSLGSETFDGLWLLITRQTSWIPFFLVILYLIYKNIGLKQSLLLLLFVAVLITFSDQITNVFKRGFERQRPCNNPEIMSFIRIVQKRDSYSFFSGHASSSMAVATFLYFIFKNYYKYLGFLFLWPLIFAYSRIYLGLHYPSDILSGFVFGVISGFIMYKIYKILQKNYFPIEV